MAQLTVNGGITATGALDVTGNSTLRADVFANSDYGSATQIYGVRAWVNYDHGDDTIMGSRGVSSVSDTATGRFTVNWSFTWPNDDYTLLVTSGGAGGASGDDSCGSIGAATNGTTSVATRWKSFTDGSSIDSDNANVMAVG